VRRAGGFTIIEILVVMAILAVLAGLGIAVLPALLRRGPKLAAETYVASLAGALEAYRNSGEGAYPPTVLADWAGVGPLTNLENCGIESIVLCLNSKNYAGSFDFEEQSGGKLDNVDGDQTQAQLTRFGDKALFEVLDPWHTPYAYLHHADYNRAAEVGLITGENGVIKVQPWKNPTTKSFYRRDTFQIISAGPDGVFNTEDDVTNFERK
jgi:prepilin-type N-terminal cleavage/methylation domain-containing protein